MSTEQFTKDQFEQALSKASLQFALLKADSEYVYTASVPNTNKRIIIRSSISPASGVADGTGRDSIRVWVDYRYKNKWFALGKGGKHHLTRLPGWQERLQEEIEKNLQFALSDSQGHGKEKSKPKPKDDGSKDAPSCPKCGAQMVLRKNRRTGKRFWGCPRFPKCRGTRNHNPDRKKEDQPPAKPIDITPSNYQEALLDAVLNSSDNLVVSAKPGSGKSTTIQWILPQLPKGLRVAVLSFNKKIAKAFKARVRGLFDGLVSTTHSLGYSLVKQNVRGAKFDEYKVVNRLQLEAKRLRQSNEELAFLIEDSKWVIATVIGLLKNTLLKPTAENIVYIIQHYNVSLNGAGSQLEEITRVIARVFEAGLPQNTNAFDYDDMLHWVAISDWPIKKFDLVFIDELQDLNMAQNAMLTKVAKRVVGVGDEMQSIYGFRGADIEAILNFSKTFAARKMPLSVSYRLPTRHIEFLNRHYNGGIEPAPGAIEGTLEHVNEYKFARDIEPGDLVLCRTNAPLIKPAYQLIRAGVKAIVLGRKIGQGLCRLVEKMRASDAASLIDKLQEYRMIEMAKLQEKNAAIAAEILSDKVNTILSIASEIEANSIQEILQEIEGLFSDDRQGVVLATVHKAKGMEADTVWILHPELIPHPKAEMDWERAQERNVGFVAHSRSKDKMFIVETDKF